MSPIKKLLLAFCMCLFSAIPLFAQSGIAYQRTTLGLPSASSPPYCIPWIDSGAKAGSTWSTTSSYIQIFPDTQYQTVTGWGGAMQEKFWDAIQPLSAAGKDSVMRAIFDTSGCNFNFCRVPIGCCDFDDKVDPISLNDSANDYDMSAFSVHRDSTKRIQLIKMAQAINPSLKFWGCPWSPPAWMHDNNTYSSGTMKSDAQTLTAYALYLSKFVKAYKVAGINMEAICCQNEPTINSGGYPKCGWSDTLELKFYKNYLIPRMKQDTIYPYTKILLGVNCCGTFDEWITYFMKDTAVANYVCATSHSYQAPDWGLTSWNKYPTVPFWQTESAFGPGPPGTGLKQNWTAGTDEFSGLTSFMNDRTTVYTQWNIVNDSTSQSGWGWAQYVMINVNQLTKKVTYNPHFYAQKHFSYYVRVGAKAIKFATTGTNPNTSNMSAFLNPNGDIIFVVGNTSSTKYDITMKVGNDAYKATLPPNSFNTFKIVKPTAVQDMHIVKNETVSGVSKARINHSTLYFTSPAIVGAQEINLTLTDLAGRTVWTGLRSGSVLHGEQQAFPIRQGQSAIQAGAYLLVVKVKTMTGALTTFTNKVFAVN